MFNLELITLSHRGHVGELSSGAWHPKDSNTFITSSADSTIRLVPDEIYYRYRLLTKVCRIWDVENKRKQKTVIVVKSKERGARTKVTACSYSHDAKYIAGGESDSSCILACSSNTVLACSDGALHLWKTNSNFVRPDKTIEGAHAKGSETGSITFSVDDRTILTRGGDDTVKRAFFSVLRTCFFSNSHDSLGCTIIQQTHRTAGRYYDTLSYNKCCF